MKKLLLFLIPLIFASIAFFLFVFFFTKDTSAKGALQVTSIPKSKVYLDGKEIGTTGLCKCVYPDMIPAGDHALRLVPMSGDQQPFEEKITINKSILTAVDRIFNGPTESEGSTIGLVPLKDPKAIEILVTSSPDGSDVLLDNNPSGETPVRIPNTTASDHDIAIKKKGYKDKVLHISTKSGYRLTVNVYLAVDINNIETSAIPTASPSGAIVTIAPSVSPSTGPKVLILDTPTGFLRVRSDPSLGGSEVGRVNPGESFDFVAEQSGWYEIKLSDGKTTGWVSSQYAKKQ